MLKTQPYTPPDGYFDLPFTWAFDASIFGNGENPLGSSIYLIGGYGNFLMRRIVGLNRILAADGTGKFQISRKFRNVYLQSDPVQAANSPEIAIAPEEEYLETGKIFFDLYGIQKPGSQPLSSQLAFQGVRRQKGTAALGPNYKFFPKTFTYQVSATIASLAGSGSIITKTPIVDYDFELYNIILMSGTPVGPGTEIARAASRSRSPHTIIGERDLLPITSPVCGLTLFDQNKVATSNIPILDIFYNGGPGSPYENGAIVPPLYYKKDSILEIDFVSQITNAGELPIIVTAYLVGRQLIPCA